MRVLYACIYNFTIRNCMAACATARQVCRHKLLLAYHDFPRNIMYKSSASEPRARPARTLIDSQMPIHTPPIMCARGSCVQHRAWDSSAHANIRYALIYYLCLPESRIRVQCFGVRPGFKGAQIASAFVLSNLPSVPCTLIIVCVLVCDIVIIARP